MRYSLPIILSSVLSCLSQGAVVYQSGSFGTVGNPGANALLSDTAANPPGNITAVKFTLASAVTVDSLEVEGIYLATPTIPTDSFSFAILSDVGTNEPSSAYISAQTVGVSRTAVGVNLFGFPLYHYTLTPAASVNLPAGTYWLAVANDTVENSPAQAWYWSASSLSGSVLAASSSMNSGYSFQTETSTPVFALNGTTVPEPASLALLAVAGTMAGYRRRRA